MMQENPAGSVSPEAVPWPELHGQAFAGCRVLVTGGAGFIGSHLVDALLELGAEVVVLDDLSGGEEANLADARARHSEALRFVHGSLLDEPVLGDCLAGARYVFHQAAIGSVPGSIEQPRRYNEVNTVGTLNVLEASRQADVRRVIFAASSSAYGDSPTQPKCETMPVLPKSPYAATKVAGEALMRAYAGSYDLDTVSLRYFNIFGPRQNANSAYAAVIAAFAGALLQGGKPRIFGDGEQSRDFTYVANAVHANLLAARAEQPLGGEVVNIACGRQISVNQLAALMIEQMGTGESCEYYEERPGDVRHSLADLQRAEQLIGYRPLIAFEQGLGATVRWYAQSAAAP